MGFWKSLRSLFRGQDAYDGGGFDRLNQGWAPVDGRGEAVNQGSRDIIRARARDLERNSDHVSAVIDAYERNVVGTGIKLQAKVIRDDGSEDDEINRRIETLWEEWCRYENCDVTKQFCFSEMQHTAVRRRLVDGGIFFIFCTDWNEVFPLRLQIKEVDELDTSVFSHGTGRTAHKVIGGIEQDSAGKTVGYHFKLFDTYGWTGKSVRVRAENVIYLPYKTRPSDIREISPLARILTRLRDLNQYMEAISVKERVLACLSVFIKKSAAPGAGFGRSGDSVDKRTGRRVKKLSPGQVEYLDPGDDVQVVNPSGQASNAGEFTTMMLRSIAAALGLSYEASSRDMSKVNYSSARQGLIDDYRTYHIWQHYLSEHLCKPVYERFLDVCITSGSLKIPGYFSDRARYTRCTAIPNCMEWIDPLKEVRANQFALESCQTTLEEICAARGKDYRDIIRQRAKEKELMREYGLQEVQKPIGQPKN